MRAHSRLIAAAMVISCLPAVADDEPRSRVIEIAARDIAFAPTRGDLEVGTAVFNVFSPNPIELDGETFSRQWSSLELERIARNRFRLPLRKIEYSEVDGGYVCISVKVWFKALANEYDSLYYRQTDDRYALVSFCTENADARARARFKQNRVKALETFEGKLAKPIVIPLKTQRVPSPGLALGPGGELLALSYLGGLPLADRNQLWRVTPGGAAERVPLVGSRTAFWRVRPHAPVVGPDGAIRLSGFLGVEDDGTVKPVPSPEGLAPVSDTPLAFDRDGGLLYAARAKSKDATSRVRLARLDADGKARKVSADTRFVEIAAIAPGADGEIWVADGREGAGSWIRRVDPNGNATTIAGSETLGFADGKGGEARFRVVSALAVGADGAVLAVDRFNRALRRITPEGRVTTIAGARPKSGKTSASENPGFRDLVGVAVGSDGVIYVLDEEPRRGRILRVTNEGEVIPVAEAPAAR